MVETYATSPIAFAASDTPPVALDGDGLAAIRNTFAAAARRASRLGVDFIEILRWAPAMQLQEENQNPCFKKAFAIPL